MNPIDAAILKARQLAGSGDDEGAWRIAADLGIKHPSNLAVLELRGMLALKRRDHAAAITAFESLARLNPGSAEAFLHLAMARHAGGHDEPAADAARRASEIKPASPAAWQQLGASLAALRRHQEAAQAFERAAKLAPDNPRALFNLGSQLLAMGKPAEAIEPLRRANTLAPDQPDILAALGASIHEAGGLGDALSLLSAAAARHPKSAEVIGHYGRALVEAGMSEEGCALLERSLALRPDVRARQQVLTMGLHYGTQDASRIRAAHESFSQRFTDGRPPMPNVPAPIEPNRRLRVAFMSADLREHSCSYFLEPLLAGLDRREFEVWGIPTLDKSDAVTDRLRAHCDGWRSIAGMDTLDAAEAIRAEAIDVLIECAGHTTGHRLDVCALRPAPLLVTFLGYPGTTGFDRIDRRLVDVVTDPPGYEPHCTERTLRIEGCLWCFRPNASAPDVAPAPVESTGRVTFGSYNMFTKVSPPVVSAWAEILRRTPETTLLLKNKWLHDAGTLKWFRSRFESLGVDPARVHAVPFAPSTRDHLDAYRLIDLQLDTFPYNGTTTTCESMWQGVPVLSLKGRIHAARVGQSLLHYAGLDELIAEDEADYVRRAVEFASRHAWLTETRRTLRERMAASPLRDETGYNARFGAAIRSAWRERCEQAVPR